MSRSFDLVVIGAGPGGYPAAIRGAQLGLSTACVERELLGGVCLNWGCIPTKALLKTAELANKIRHADDYGLTVAGLDVDFPRVVARSRGVAKRFNRGVAGLFKKYGVTEVKGTARLTGPGRVEVTSSEGVEVIEARHVVVATGARAKVFPGIEPDGERILTYREAIVSERRPESVTVLGAGAIGIEFAYFWHAMGAEVTVVEAQDEILPLEDRELGAALRKVLLKQGIRFVLGTFVDRVERDGDATVVHLKSGDPLRADTTLVALGITPNTEGLGLAEAGVRLDKRGFISVDASYRTSAGGVYAVGDVASLGPALAHTATRQAHVCVERIAGHHVPDVDYDAMPSCTYCMPQVASVGLTEERCKAEGIAYKVGRFPFAANGKAQGAGQAEGFVKVIVGERYGDILGAHILGAEATEMIGEFVLARSAEATAELITFTTHAHPTNTEASLEAVAQALGVSVHI